MQISQVPTKFSIPFANGAGSGYIRPIPTASQIGVTNGAASLTDGFPPLCFLPVGSGGVPPFGQDMNGILNQVTQWNRWNSAGGLCLYDSVFSTAIGGYPQGALLASSTVGQIWLNTVDNNTSNPDSAGAGWLKIPGVGGSPSYVPYPGYTISGFVPSAMSGTSTTASMTISAGTANDTTHQASVSTGTTLSWSVTNGDAANGYQGGSTLPNSSTIFMYAMWGASGIASFASTSLTPTLPSGYTYYRRIFAFTTTSAGAPVPFSAIEGPGGILTCYLSTTIVGDWNNVGITSSRQLVALSVPTGISVEWMGSIDIAGSGPGSNLYVVVTSPIAQDVAPGTWNGTTMNDIGVLSASANSSITALKTDPLITDTSGRLAMRGNQSYSGIYAATVGWKLYRNS